MPAILGVSGADRRTSAASTAGFQPGAGSSESDLGTVEFVKIGELADTAGVTTKTIRYYESIGVLDEPARTGSGYRSYGPDAVERLDFVKQAQSSGLALAEIRSILEIKDRGGQSCEHTRTLLGRHLDELDKKIIELQRARVELRNMFDRAAALDPAECTDANRCQVITETSAGT
jgi:DNA-binding transcriptional MerR regulator